MDGLISLPGNWISLLLLLLSLFSLTIILERGYTLYWWAGGRLRRERLWLRSRLDAGASFCGSADGLKHPLNAGLRGLLRHEYPYGGAAAEHAEESLLALSLFLKRRVGFLGTVSAIAPLLGLLGSVTGMIQSFRSFSVADGGSSLLPGGMEQALVTTAQGLMVAIPALFFYNLFAGTINHLLADTEMLQRRIRAPVSNAPRFASGRDIPGEECASGSMQTGERHAAN